MKRKEAVKILTAGTLGLGFGGSVLGKSGGLQPDSQSDRKSQKAGKSDRLEDRLEGNINHSACRWCYADIPLDELADQAKEIGLVAIDLLKPSEWAMVTDKGLACSMANPEKFSLTEGFNDPKNHEALIKTYTELIPRAAEAGVKNIICFSGNRNGMDDTTGLENCARGLEKVAKVAEKHQVQVMMELLNSKVNHPDYQCDHTPWGVQLCEKIGSPNFQLLYDIYHMQIMEGDIIATIRKYHPYIGHYHTGGVPGRHEINDSQELNYPAIMRAIVETGFKGYVAQEFVPTYDDPLKALKEGVEICDV